MTEPAGRSNLKTKMRQAILLGRKHGGKVLEVIHGPDVPIAKQLDTYNKFKGTHQAGKLVNDRFEYVELWERHLNTNPLTFAPEQSIKKIQPKKDTATT